VPARIGPVPVWWRRRRGVEPGVRSVSIGVADCELQVEQKGSDMAVEVGDSAPDFELKDQHGTPVRLSDFRGRRTSSWSSTARVQRGVHRRAVHHPDELPTWAARTSKSSRSRSTRSSPSVPGRRRRIPVPAAFGLLATRAVAQSYGVFDDGKGLAARGPTSSTSRASSGGRSRTPSPTPATSTTTARPWPSCRSHLRDHATRSHDHGGVRSVLHEGGGHACFQCGPGRVTRPGASLCGAASAPTPGAGLP